MLKFGRLYSRIPTHTNIVRQCAGSMGAVCGLSPMISALSVNPSETTSPIYLLPRFSDEKSVGSRDWRVPVEAPSQMWLLHVGNAFQVKDVHGNSHIQIYAASCSYQWFNFQKLFGKSSSKKSSFVLRKF